MLIDPKARDILREYDRYTWTPEFKKQVADKLEKVASARERQLLAPPPHRKDTTMDKFTITFPGIHGESKTRDDVMDILEADDYYVTGYGESKEGRYICFGEKPHKPCQDKHQRWETVSIGEGDMQVIKFVDGETIASGICYTDANYIVNTHNAALNHADPKEPSILDEEWENSSDMTGIYNAEGTKIASVWEGIFADPIAALPDSLRALVEIRDHTDGHDDAYIIDGILMAKICAALKKAGIE